MWDGSSWSTIGNNGTNSSVNSITGNNSGTIYIGGNFTIVDYGGINQSANYIVIWHGYWILLQPGGNISNGLNGNVNTLYYNNNANILYVGGLFTYAYLDTISSIVPYYNSVKWNLNSTSWDYIGATQQINGVNGEVFSIFNNDNNTYIAGTFNLAGYDGTNSMNKVQNITYFDGGSKWFPLNYHRYQPGVDGEVFALAVIGDDIYVGGNFHFTAPTQSEPYNICNYIARWNTINEVWYPLNYIDHHNQGNLGLDGVVRALSTNGTLLFVGGDFTKIYGNSTLLNYIAIWNPTLETWTQIITTDNASNVGYGLDSSVLGLSCRFPYETLYVSGSFTKASSTEFQLYHIASFNLNNIGTKNGFQKIMDTYGNIGTDGTANTILDVYPRVYFGGNFNYTAPNNNVTMNYLGYYLYIYISNEVVVLYISDPGTPPRQFLDTQTGIISPTYTLTNRFKSVILINCEEENILPSKYWLIMYRS